MCCDPEGAKEYGIGYAECVPWDGEESSLPNGGDIKAPDVFIWDLVKEWKTTGTGKVIGAIMDEVSIKTIIETYGARGILIAESVGNNLLTRSEWKDNYGTDGFVLWAICSYKLFGARILNTRKQQVPSADNASGKGNKQEWEILKEQELAGRMKREDYIIRLKNLLDKNFITKDYYDIEKHRILDEMFGLK
jgi:hypothetical protein